MTAPFTPEERARYHADTQAEMLRLARVKRERLAWCTLVLDAIPVNREIDWHAAGINIAEQNNQFLVWYGSFSRKYKLRSAGVLELDLVCGNFLPQSHKAMLISDLGINCFPRRILIPHLHFVCDMGEKFRHDELQWSLSNRYHGRRRVMVKPLYKNPTVESNLRNLASYCTKLRFEYSESWSDQPTEYSGRKWEPSHCTGIRTIIDACGGINSLHWSLRLRSYQ